MNILAIGAHPDDIETGCGGTLLKLKSAGHKIYLMILSDGAEGGNSEIRKIEAQKAADFLGAEKIFWADCLDTQIQASKQLITFIEKISKEINADEVYFNYLEDEHQDHRNLALAAIPATRYIKKVFMYESYSTKNFVSDFYVDIKDVLEKKIDLLKCHQSQLDKVSPSHLNLVDSVKAFAHYRGFASRLLYAEGFKIQKYIRDI